MIPTRLFPTKDGQGIREHSLSGSFPTHVWIDDWMNDTSTNSERTPPSISRCRMAQTKDWRKTLEITNNIRLDRHTGESQWLADTIRTTPFSCTGGWHVILTEWAYYQEMSRKQQRLRELHETCSLHCTCRAIWMSMKDNELLGSNGQEAETYQGNSIWTMAWLLW